MTKFEISTWSIVKTILVLLGFWLLWQIQGIVVLLFVVFILVATLGSTVDWLTAHRLPRAGAASLVIVGLILALSLVLAAVIPALIHQLQTFAADQFPALVERLTPYYQSITEGRELLVDLVRQLQKLSGGLLLGVANIFGGLFSAITVLVLTFYLLLEKHPLQEAGIALFPLEHREQVVASLERVTDKLGAWLRGQVVLSVVVGTITGLAMWVIGVPAPLALGVVAGLLEIIPIVGPLITGILILLMAVISPSGVLIKLILGLVFFVLLQILEGQILVPKIMHKAIGLSPVIVIVALLVGGQIGGIPGAILAIPVATIIQVIAHDWPQRKNLKT
ncbi:AI-2E family transporter [Candidatus Berkelbacteria bacterium]|nr:AI-2E family transporter [Candidatus Berkelbacteria bacterium]